MMKNLKIILIAIFFLQSVISFGQTKEETVKYINDIVSTSKGFAYTTTGAFIEDVHIKSQEFSLERFVCSEISYPSSASSENNVSYIYTSIPWMTISKIEKLPIRAKSNLVGIIISFEGHLYQNTNTSPDMNHEKNQFVIYVISSKADNVEKALKHLQELNKKEDLFGN